MKKLLIVAASVLLLGAGCVSINLNSSPESVNSETDQPVVAPSTSNISVDLSDQNLAALPSYILERTDIEELDISGNKMTGALPAEIRHLSRLRVLNASNNQFTGVPAEIGQLTNLQVLDYSHNQLTGLPNELGNLSNLQVLDLTGNDVSEYDLEIIRLALPAGTEIRW
ncbi:leucine-rich repeat domain-containing protein [Patescibacteria group bacterium]|nr:leucine-rich repeat domain-containing protein [Patescibacteria group bacterium]MBU1705426.1 leucine-rich repeat domain-containing protein [Patescibacteria group bacterium]